MKEISLLYRDRFERSSRFLIKEYENFFGFKSINFASIAKQNINENTPLGAEANKFIKEGKFVPCSIFQNMIEVEINSQIAEKLIIINYPKNLEQLQLLNKYIGSTNSKFCESYYIKSQNAEQNFSKDGKMMQIEEKYKSKDYILMNAKRSKSANESIVSEIQKITELIEFEVEAFGINVIKENEEIKRTIHNKRR